MENIATYKRTAISESIGVENPAEKPGLYRRIILGALAATAISLVAASETAPADASTISSEFVAFGHPATKYGDALAQQMIQRTMYWL